MSGESPDWDPVIFVAGLGPPLHNHGKQLSAEYMHAVMICVDKEMIPSPLVRPSASHHGWKQLLSQMNLTLQQPLSMSLYEACDQ